MKLRRLLITTFITGAIAFPVTAKRQKTTIPGKLKEIPAAPSPDLPAGADTLTTGLDSLLSFAGYDKPLTSSRETIHVTNLSDSLTVNSVTIEITYLDRKQRQLHKRQVTLDLMLSPGETTLAAFPTWDSQHSFYYIRSVKPRRQATPYTITVAPLSATVTPLP